MAISILLSSLTEGSLKLKPFPLIIGLRKDKNSNLPSLSKKVASLLE